MSITNGNISPDMKIHSKANVGATPLQETKYRRITLAPNAPSQGNQSRPLVDRSVGKSRVEHIFVTLCMSLNFITVSLCRNIAFHLIPRITLPKM